MSIFSSIKSQFSPVYKTANRYYKTRLKVLRESDARKRLEALNILNQMQPTLDTLEMGNVSFLDRGKYIQQIKSSIKKVELILKNKTLNQNIQNSNFQRKLNT